MFLFASARIRIRIELKCWIRIRIQVNPDPQPWLLGQIKLVAGENFRNFNFMTTLTVSTTKIASKEKKVSCISANIFTE
jgi:hypothetical protein